MKEITVIILQSVLKKKLQQINKPFQKKIKLLLCNVIPYVCYLILIYIKMSVHNLL